MRASLVASSLSLALSLSLSSACASSASYRPYLLSPTGERLARVRLELVHVRTDSSPVPLFLEVANASSSPLTLVPDRCRLTTADVESRPLRVQPDDPLVQPRSRKRFRLDFPRAEVVDLGRFDHEAHLVFEHEGDVSVLEHRVWTEDHEMSGD